MTLIRHILYIDKECNHLRLYVVDIDSGKDFDYNGRRHYNTFFSYKDNRTIRRDGSMYTGSNTPEFTSHIPEHILNTSIKCSSMKEFFNVINYDYKTKKYREINDT